MGCKRNRMKKGAFIAAVMLSVALMGCQKAEERRDRSARGGDGYSHFGYKRGRCCRR